MLERIVMGLKNAAERVAYALAPSVEELILRAGYHRLDTVANIQAAYELSGTNYLESLPQDLQEVLPALAAYNWYALIGIRLKEIPDIKELVGGKVIPSERQLEFIQQGRLFVYDFRIFFNPARQETIIKALPRSDTSLHSSYFWGPWREGENALVKRLFLAYISSYIEQHRKALPYFTANETGGYSINISWWPSIIFGMAERLGMRIVSPITVDPLRKKLLNDIKQSQTGSKEQKVAPIESIDRKVSNLNTLHDEELDLMWKLIGLSDALRRQYRIVDNRRWYHKLLGTGRQKTVKDILHEKRQGLEKRINRLYLDAKGTPYESMAVALRKDMVSEDQIEKDFEGPNTKLNKGQTIEFGTVTSSEDME